MNPAELERFRDVEEIFYAAIEQPAGVERDALVRDRCGADDKLRSEVALLLEEHESIRAASASASPYLPLFGAWQAVKLLGRGGMGTVYLAERADGAFRMSAAVKVVPLALVSTEIEERFRRERQFLASLDHPRIARLLDGGVSETGLPYLVMEFVAGQTIQCFCEAHGLDARARIGLVRQVLDALAYVHGRQVLHRDVKPSNILVDEAGNVKLLDFGTARLVNVTAEAELTKTGVFAFTPDYASPEQIRGEPCSFASDLYSVGVLLDRLLTGRRPLQKLAQNVAPLDAILAKALRRNAANRYGSAAEMDADLARYLAGGRVRARRPRGKLWAAVCASLVLGAAFWAIDYAWPARGRAHALVPFDAGVPDAAQPALSYDGKWLAFASPAGQGARTDIWLKRMPKGAPQRVTTADGSNDEPALSSDGQWLGFHSTRQPPGIYLQPAAGGVARLLVPGGRAPRFSPDGQWIAYLNSGEMGGDTWAPNTRFLYRIPARGGTPLRLARSASSVQGAAWSPDSRGMLLLATDERAALRLWRAPLDGGAPELIPEFMAPAPVGRACGVIGNRFFYTTFDNVWMLGEFLLAPPLSGARFSSAVSPSRLPISGCSASANGTVLTEEDDSVTSAWMLPIDAEGGALRGSLELLTELERGDYGVQLTPDGESFFVERPSTGSYRRDYRTGTQSKLPGAALISADGLFALRLTGPAANPSMQVLNLKTGASWGRMVTLGAPWDLSSGGQWLLSVGTEAYRTITAWDTRTAEHRTIYARPGANLYLASFSQDGRWALFTSEEAGRQPRMWAAPFRHLQSVPPADWVDLGTGDYPRWSPAGRRIYFIRTHDGFECLFTRAVDPATKRPSGAVTEVQHFHGRLTPQGLRPGFFRLSVARDKLGFVLGKQTHHLFQWR